MRVWRDDARGNETKETGRRCGEALCRGCQARERICWTARVSDLNGGNEPLSPDEIPVKLRTCARECFTGEQMSPIIRDVWRDTPMGLQPRNYPSLYEGFHHGSYAFAQFAIRRDAHSVRVPDIPAARELLDIPVKAHRRVPLEGSRVRPLQNRL